MRRVLMRLPNTLAKLYDEAFVLKDPLGKPLQAMPYKITASDGVEKSASEADGKSIRVPTDASEKLKFELRWVDLDGTG